MKDARKKLYKLKFDWDKPWIPFIAIFIIAFIIVLVTGFLLGEIEWDGIFIEATGMLLDIIFLGIIWAFLEYRRSKKLEINQYKNEIKYFRKWKSEEAMYRIVGNVNRLKKLGIHEVDLSYCYLKDAELWNLKCSGDLAGADLRNAKLAGSDLKNISLMFTDFEDAHLYDSKFNGSTIFGANFKGANLKSVDFRECKEVDNAYFWGAKYIYEAKFDKGIDIEKLKNQKRKTSPLGVGEDFFRKKRFVELYFNCTIMEFRISEYNVNSIILRFTKEGFSNYKNLISITGEHKHYYFGLIQLDDLMKELEKETTNGQ